MAKLSVAGQQYLERKRVITYYSLAIAGVSFSGIDLISYSLQIDRSYGAKSCTLTLNNNQGKYSPEGSSPVEFGSEVVFNTGYLYGKPASAEIIGTPTPIIVDYTGADNEDNLADSFIIYNQTRKSARYIVSVDKVLKRITTKASSDNWEEGDIILTYELFDTFEGIVRQINPVVMAGNNIINLVCLDKVVRLEDIDIQKTFEAPKVQVLNEVLSPQYLPAPNDMMAQVFNYANYPLSISPIPNIRFYDKTLSKTEPQPSGFEVRYQVGQLLLGTPINARDNFDVRSDYFFHPTGLHAEDLIYDILKEPDGYGNDVFLDSDLQDNFFNLLGNNSDILTPNYITETIAIKTQLTQACSPGDDTIYLESTEGFPDSGEGKVNGDTFTWTNKTSTSLSGIPATGENALRGHPLGAYVTYTADYSPGQCWYLTYNNLITDLISSDFTVAGGASIEHISKRFGRIILDQAISIASVVKCNTNYTFKTIQATGIEINYMGFTFQGIANRLEAISKVREFLPPNYIVYAKSGKIWATYLSQKYDEDYTLQLATQFDYAEDQDIFTRVKLFGKNANPHNICKDEGVAFVQPQIIALINKPSGISSSDIEIPYDSLQGGVFKQRGTVTIESEQVSYTGNDGSQLTGCTRGANGTTPAAHADDSEIISHMYSATAYNQELTWIRDEGNWAVFQTGISEAGFIMADNFVPVVYINNVPVNDEARHVTASQVLVREHVDVVTTVESGWSDTEVSTTTYYTYTIYFTHSGIMSSEPIYVYDATGATILTISPYDSNMDYTHGIYHVPGSSQNSTIMTASTASYWVFYSTSKIQIDYDQAEFKVNRDLLGKLREDVVSADFEYADVVTPPGNAGYLIDGNWNTQTQTVFFAEPAQGYVYAILDLGSVQHIDAIDIMAGVFKPDEVRKFPFTNFYTIQYSTDNITYYNLCRDATNFSLSAHDAKTFDRDDFGDNFQARYFKLVLESAEKIDFENGRWCIAFVDISIYKDTVLESEAKLIPTTKTTQELLGGETTVFVEDTFSFPDNGSFYLNKEAEVIYTGKTPTSFTGCSGVTAQPSGVYAVEELEGDTTLYDEDGLLVTVGDKLYKDTEINEYLSTIDAINKRVKNFLKEFYKNHTKMNSNILFGAHYQIGDTLRVIDSESNVDKDHFIESINNDNGQLTLTLARYPGEFERVN